MSPLERRYRQVLRCYPQSYRDARGDELLTTLLDLAPPGRTRPTVGDLADLVEGGLRTRLGLATVDGLADGLTRAAPVALALTGGLSAFLWGRVEPLGPPTLGPVAYAAWLAAGAVALLAPARLLRPALAGALAVTAVLPLVAPMTVYDRPPLWVLMALAVFGLLALAGTDGFRRGAERRAAPALGAVAVACGADVVTHLWRDGTPGHPHTGYYQPAVAQAGLVVAAAVAVLACLALADLRRGGAARPWLWATLLIALPGAWLGPFDAASWPVTGELPRFGRLAQVLLGTCVVVGAMAHLRTSRRAAGVSAAARPAAVRGCRPASAAGAKAGPSPAGGVEAGGPVGVGPAGTPARAAAGSLLAGYAGGLLVFAGLLDAVTGHVAATVTVCVGAGLLLGPSATRRVLAQAGAAAAGTLAAAYAVGVYSNDWAIGGWVPVRTAGLAVMLAVVPLACGAYTAFRRPRRGTAPAAGLLCLGWLAWLTLPGLPAWGPVLPVLLAVPAVWAALPKAAGPGHAGP
ncbi:hypothetical protein CS0771_71060 [Catellatospora sp. IY07-71]|uniref:hypothetical protein n=1 Tax=Catellatospora sp. IY07-71 TaxID=2728827 RepID=UPI001BB3EBD6|nr:hypothetical protein [Catellatospora sp. IY07-71]BCJ77562.1 hypothetical protein CS0771_71060 [Catellatospora sp. IY07-71]